MKRIKLLLILLASTLIMQAQTTYQISALVLTANYLNYVPNYPVMVIDSSSGTFGSVAVYNYVTDTSGTFSDSLTTQGSTGTLWFLAPDSCGFATIAIGYSPNSPSTLATAGLVLCNNNISSGPFCNYSVSALFTAGLNNLYEFHSTHQNNPVNSSNYLWDFGDGNTSTYPTPWYAYSQPGTYYYCLQVDSCPVVCDSVVVTQTGDNCSDSISILVSLNHVEIYPVHSVIPGSEIIIDWGDGAIDTVTPLGTQGPPFMHLYSQSGTYNISYTHNNTYFTCSKTKIHTITLGATSPLQCNATYVVDTVNSQPGTVILWNTSNVLGGNPNSTQVSFFWDFGDGNSSTQAYPTHNYSNPGTYAICLTIAALDSMGTGVATCTSTHCDTITVDQNGNLIYKGAIMGWTLKVLNPNTIGVDEDALSDIEVYPNPAKDYLKLHNPSANEVSYQLLNTNGQLVQAGIAQDTETTIEMTNLASGIYILQVQVEQDHKQFKIVKW